MKRQILYGAFGVVAAVNVVSAPSLSSTNDDLVKQIRKQLVSKDPWLKFFIDANGARNQGNMAEAERSYLLALAEAKKEGRPRLVVSSNMNLGMFYYRQGKYLQAKPYFDKVLSAAEKSKDSEIVRWGIDSVDVLAFIAMQQGKYREAEADYARFGSAGLSASILNPVNQVDSLIGRANVLCLEGRYNDARSLLAQAASRLAAIHSPTVDKNAQITNAADLKNAFVSFLTSFSYRLKFDLAIAQGNLQLAEGHVDEAETIFRTACDTFKVDFKTEQPGIVPGYIGLGKAAMARGRLPDAQNRFTQAKKLLEGAPLKELQLLETCKISLAEVAIRQGQYKQAESSLTESKSTLEKNVGTDTPPVADCWLDLGKIYAAENKDAEAEAAFRKALVIKGAVLAKGSAALGPVSNALADVLVKEGKSDDAQSLYASCITAYEKESLSGNVEACMAMIGEADILQQKGNQAQAETLYRGALGGLEKYLLPTDQHLIKVYGKLAEIYLSESKYPQAETVLRRQAAGLERQGKNNDANYALTIDKLVQAEIAQEKWNDAQANLSKLLALCETGKAGSVDDLKSLDKYLDVLGKLNKTSDAEQVKARLEKLQSNKSGS